MQRIPRAGDGYILESDWTLALTAEWRNKQLLDILGGDYLGRDRFVPAAPPVVITLPTTMELVVSDIEVRQRHHPHLKLIIKSAPTEALVGISFAVELDDADNLPGRLESVGNPSTGTARAYYKRHAKAMKDPALRQKLERKRMLDLSLRTALREITRRLGDTNDIEMQMHARTVINDFVEFRRVEFDRRNPATRYPFQVETERGRIQRQLSGHRGRANRLIHCVRTHIDGDSIIREFQVTESHYPPGIPTTIKYTRFGGWRVISNGCDVTTIEPIGIP